MKNTTLLFVWLLLSCGSVGNDPGYAYIVNKDNSTILRCPYSSSSSSVSFSQCAALPVTGLTNPIKLVFDSSTSVTPSRLYISNFGADSSSNQILQCNYVSGTINGCARASYTGYDFAVNINQYGSYLYVPSYSNDLMLTYNIPGTGPLATVAISAPTDIYFTAINNVLVSSQSATGSNKILSCSVNTGSIGNCTTALDLGSVSSLSIGMNGGFYYFTLPQANLVRKCSYSNNVLSACVDVGDSTLYNYPYGITFQDNKVYIPNRQAGVNSIVVCNVSATDGSFSNCALETAGGLLNGPTWVVFQ